MTTTEAPNATGKRPQSSFLIPRAPAGGSKTYVVPKGAVSAGSGGAFAGRTTDGVAVSGVSLSSSAATGSGARSLNALQKKKAPGLNLANAHGPLKPAMKEAAPSGFLAPFSTNSYRSSRSQTSSHSPPSNTASSSDPIASSQSTTTSLHDIPASLAELSADHLADLIRKSRRPSTSSTSTASPTVATPRQTTVPTRASSTAVAVKGGGVDTRRGSMQSDSTGNSTLIASDSDEPADSRKSDETTRTSASDGAPVNLLLLDVRSYMAYSSARVSSAVNLCVPSTLLKRPAFNVDKLLETLRESGSTDPSTRDLLVGPAITTTAPGGSPRISHVVLYDADSERLPDGSPIALLGAKLEAGRGRIFDSAASMGWLRGGFKAFAARYGDLCDGGPPRQRQPSPGPPQSSSSSSVNMRSVMGPPPPCLQVNVSPSTWPSPAAPEASTSLRPNPVDPFSSTPVMMMGGLALGMPNQQLGVVNAVGAGPGGVPQQRVLESPGSGCRYVQPESPPDLFNLDVLQSGRHRQAPVGTPDFLRELIRGDDARGELVGKWQWLESEERARLEMACRARTAADPFSVSVGLESGVKNRYSNIWPFNCNRVKLATSDPSEDYINASLILPPTTSQQFLASLPHNPTAPQECAALLHSRRRYIATQGPLPNTTPDFWRMTWDHDARVVLMLCDVDPLGRKCHPYFPTTPGERHDHPTANIAVTLLAGRQARTHITVRTFRLDDLADPAAGPRVIAHICYTGWPDEGVPERPESFLALHHLVESVKAELGAFPADVDLDAYDPDVAERPVVVHCSAGCGRTGAYVALDAMLAMMYPDLHPVAAGAAGAGGTGAAGGPSMIGRAQTPTTTMRRITAIKDMMANPAGGGVGVAGTSASGPAAGTRDAVLLAVDLLRSQRVSMVQTLPQFLFLYEVVLARVRHEAGGEGRERYVRDVVRPERVQACIEEIRALVDRVEGDAKAPVEVDERG